MFNRLVVPVDGSEPSNKTVSLAIEFAKNRKASIIFCHAIDEVSMIRAAGAAGVDWQPGVDDLRREGKRVLDAAMTQASQAGVEAHAVMSDRGPVDTILDAVRDHVADLIVMGTHGRRGFSRAVLGSVTEAALRHAHVPILVVTPPMHIDTKAR